MLTGTNDVTNDVNTMKHVRSITKIMEEMKGGGDIQVGFPGIIERRDHDLGEKIKEIIKRLERCCSCKGFVFTDNSNIDESSLNRSLLHLSRCGNMLFSGNHRNALKGFPPTDIYTNDTDITKHLSTANTDIFRFLKNSV